MKNVWFIHCRRTNRIGIYVVQLTWLVWVFSICLRQVYHISDSYIFFFWEVGERQRTGFPLSLLGVAWGYLCAIYGPMHVCLLLGEYLHECAQSVGLYVCVVCWTPVYVRVYVKCSHKCLAMFLWCGDGDGGGACVYVSAIDIICPLDVIPIQMSLMTKPFGLAHRWEELLCFLCPKFRVFSISFTCVFASMAL